MGGLDDDEETVRGSRASGLVSLGVEAASPEKRTCYEQPNVDGALKKLHTSNSPARGLFANPGTVRIISAIHSNTPVL